MIKSLFACLFEKWENNEKFNFIKNDNYIQFEKFNCSFGDFNKYKKTLFEQILKLFNLLNEDNDKKQFIDLIFHFLLETIEEYKSIGNNINESSEEIKFVVKKFLHLFESKSLMNEIFNYFLLNKEIINDNDNKHLQDIIFICNSAIEYHPKPFVFSFLKMLLKNENINNNFTDIFNGISENIINNLKIDSDLMTQENNKDFLKKTKLTNDSSIYNDIYTVNSYFYFN